ncbi:MAG: DnaB-like helicase C-terminal domain-containing protein [Selenomonadaceae bacterium]|nr:DnaB-like helicase C-terminal domain-containing protein [Selenomonadaceae bacterium]
MNTNTSNIEAEKYLLLTCMNSDKYLEILAEMPVNMGEMFERQEHRILYKAITEVVKCGSIPDGTAVGIWLMNNKMSQLVRGEMLMPTGHTYEKIPHITKKEELRFYIETVKNCYQNRRVQSLCQNAILNIKNGVYAYDVIGDITKGINEVVATSDGVQSQSSHDIVSNFIKDMKNGDNKKGGLYLGYPNTFHRVIGLLGKQQIMTVGARTSVGKSLVICNLMLNLSLQKKRVVYFDLEMSTNDFASRMIAPLAKVNTNVFKYSAEEVNKKVGADVMQQIEKAGEILSKGEPIERYDTAGLTIEEIIAKIKASHTRKPIDLVVIDHIGLVRASRKDETPRITINNTMSEMRKIVKELNISALLASQINRGGVERPKLEFLKESGRVEDDSDIVALLHRPPREEINESNKNCLEVDFAKNKTGNKGVVTMNVNYACQLMLDGYTGEIGTGTFQGKILDKKSPEAKEAKSLFDEKRK